MENDKTPNQVDTGNSEQTPATDQGNANTAESESLIILPPEPNETDIHRAIKSAPKPHRPRQPKKD